MAPRNRKRIAPLDSPGTAGGAESPLPAKKQKHYNASLFPDSKEWPPLDTIWEAVGNCASESYLKSQGTFEEYTSTTCIFLGRLCLVVRGLHLDQLMVIFRATAPQWYNTVA